MDYSKIEILEDRRGTLYSFGAITKLKRLLFSLSLYPDWRMASKFANVRNRRAFLPYWIGKEQYNLLLENVNERRKVIEESDEDLFTILENVFTKYQGGGNYLSPFLTDDDIIQEEVSNKITKLEYEPVMAALGIGKNLSPLEVLQQLDTIIAIEKTKRNVKFETGRYWIVSYSQEIIRTQAKPFILLAKIGDNNCIEYVQGSWPITYMKDMLNGIVPLPYETSLQDMKYVCIEVETMIKTTRDGKEIEIEPLFGYRYKIEQC